MSTTEPPRGPLVGIDFEMANNINGSICAFGLAFEDGTSESDIIRLHPELGGVQERGRWHHISPARTAAGAGPEVLYSALQSLAPDTILVAHDAKIDRSYLYGWFEMWDLEPIHFAWFDTLRIARREFGKRGRVGIAAMAAHLGMTVTPHDPRDDATVALEIARKYPWDKFSPTQSGA